MKTYAGLNRFPEENPCFRFWNQASTTGCAISRKLFPLPRTVPEKRDRRPLLIDKNPSLTTLIPRLIGSAETKFLVALRDPRDVCLSSSCNLCPST